METSRVTGEFDGESPLDVSVLICTRDRADSLRRTLASIARAVVPLDLSWEVIVVNNNSSDRTSEVICSFNDRLPIREVIEPEAGLSRARNRGVSVVRGRRIIWTDDDVEVDRNWLTSYQIAFSRWADIAIFGGSSIAIFEEPSVPWFQANAHILRDLLAVRDFTKPVALSLRKGDVPFGLNYSVRSDVQRQFLYDPDLGVAPGRRISGEEIDFFKRAIEAGYKGMCLAEPRVHHHLPLSRQTLEYVKSYYRSAGETSAILRFRLSAPATSTVAVIWLKFLVARLLHQSRSLFQSSTDVPSFIRDAFHTGVVEGLRNNKRPDRA